MFFRSNNRMSPLCNESYAIHRVASWFLASFAFVSLGFSANLQGQDSAPATQESPAKTDDKADSTTPKESAQDKPAAAQEPKKDDANGKTETKAEERTRKVSPREKTTAKKQLRQLSLSGNYEDLVQPGSFDPTALLLGGVPGKSKSFFRLCEYLEEMAAEENLTHLLFDLSDPNLNLNSAQLDELVRRLRVFKSKGKRTIAWLENAGNVHLAIAANCDDVLMADFGSIDMPSSSMETMFYKDAMDLLGVKASVVRAGDFKGAVEPYLNPVMSEHLKAHYVAMLESINAAQVSRIAKGRGLTTAKVRELQKKRMLLPADAMAAGLVTKLAPYGAMKKAVQEIVGNDIEWTKPKTKPKREVSVFELMSKAMAGPKESNSKLKDDSIVVLHMQGAIQDGKEKQGGAIVSGPMVKAIEELIADEKVKGVVVRINSPGGSATASEAIRQSLLELSQKKPVVFSMGEMAASGGYWITCIGQPIFAEQGTITGSIGVFSLKISAGSLFRRVGVHVESISLDPSASSDAIDRAWSDEEIANMQRFIDDVYGKFLAYASESRKIPVEKLQSLAGGRVWSGDQAKHAGLVDEIGGVDDCIQMIAKKSNLAKYKIIHRPEPGAGLDLFSMFDEGGESDVFAGFLSEKQADLLVGWLERGFKLDAFKTLMKYSRSNRGVAPTVWALMPEEFRVR